MRPTSRASRSPAAVACRKAPGGRTTSARPILSVGPELRDDLAMAREPGDAPAFGDLRKHAHARGRQRSRSPHIDVEARIGRRYLDIERLARATERLGDCPGGLDRAVECRRQDRTAVDRHDVMRLERGKSDLEDVAGAAPRVEYGAASSLPVGVERSSTGASRWACASAPTTRARFQSR